MTSQNTLTKEEVARLRDLQKILGEFRNLDSEMPLQQAVTLVTIALNEGISLADLAERTEQATSSTSRNVAALSSTHRAGKKGHNLVLNREDPLERRRKQHVLTPKGLTFIRRLLEVMKG